MEKVRWFISGVLAMLVVFLTVKCINSESWMLEYSDEVWVPEKVAQVAGYLVPDEGNTNLAFEEFQRRSEAGEITPTLMAVSFYLTVEPNCPKGAFIQYFARNISEQTFWAEKRYNFLTYRIPEGLRLSCGNLEYQPPF